MRKYILLGIVLILSAQLLAGCSCEHQWIDATCNSGRVCSICGTSEGDPLAHIWTDATCTASRTCTLCAATEGDPLGHSWTDATCTAPKICALCAAQDGDPLPHTPGEAETSTDYVRAVQIETQACTECGTVLSTNETTVSLVDGDCFLLSPTEFVARLNHIYASTGKTNWTAELVVESRESKDFFMGVVSCDDVVYARLFFGTSEDDPTTKQKIVSLTEKEKSDRIVSLTQVVIYYSEIADQLYDFSMLTTSEASDHVSALHSNEDLFVNIVTPIILTYGSALGETEADAFVRDAYQHTSNYFDYENIHFTDKCSDLYVEFANFFLANLSYMINISTSSEYWTEVN